MVIKLAVVAAYVLLMLGIGFWCMRRTKSSDDFFLGGRTLGPWMSAFAFGTTYFSAVLFIGYAGKLGWGFGLHTMWIVLGNTIIGTLLSWRVLAGPTRDMTARLGAMTMPEFLRARFGSKEMQVLGALIVFVFLVPYSASVYMGLSYLFEKGLGLQYNEALISLAVLTGLYLVMGGYFAVAVSDFIRGIVEFGGVLVMMLMLAGMKGGLAHTFGELANHAHMPALYNPPAPGAFPGWVTLASLVLITSFGPWALPQMVQKFYSIRDKADVKRAMTIASIFAFFMAFGAYYSGALTHLFFDNPAKDFAPIVDAATGKANLDLLMPHFITTFVPSWLMLVILLMVFSASMSSLSSLVLVSSSAIAIDLLGAFRGQGVAKDDRRTMAMMRVFCLVFVAASLAIAMSKVDVIVNLMVMSWGALSGAFLAPYVYGLFWRRTTKAGAMAGMLSGVLTCMALVAVWGKANVPVAGAVAMIVPMVVVPIVSLLTPAPPRDIIDGAFGTADSGTGGARNIAS